MKSFRNKALRSIGLALCALGLTWHIALSAFGPALAAAFASESFAYPVGELVGQNGGAGWGGAWGGQTDNTEIASASLTYTVPGGGIVDGGTTALQIFGADNDNAAFRTLAAAQNADSVFVSFLVRFDGTVDNNDFLGLWFDNVTTGDHRPVPNIGIKGNREDGSGPEDFFARVADPPNTAFEVYSTDINASPAGTTFFVVGRLFKSVSGAANVYDRFSLWVNPVFGDEATPDATATLGTGAISSFTTIGFRLNGLDTGDSILFDELCLGTTWQDCVPGCQLTCPANITISNDPNQCGAVVNYPAPTTSGSCGTVTCSPASGSFFPVGTTTITCTAQAGPSCQFTITVVDTQPPTITCPANVTAVAAPTCPPSVSTTVTFPPPTASDNCPGVTTSCDPASGSVLPVGVTTVTCTATDASGNTATCSFTVTVFSGCLQDDSNPGSVVLFNVFTGQYVFCCNGVLLASGTGTVTLQGCDFTIQHNPPGWRVLIKGSFAYKRGSASLQKPPGTIKCTITDRNITNNTCACPVT